MLTLPSLRHCHPIFLSVHRKESVDFNIYGENGKTLLTKFGLQKVSNLQIS